MGGGGGGGGGAGLIERGLSKYLPPKRGLMREGLIRGGGAS